MNDNTVDVKLPKHILVNLMKIITQEQKLTSLRMSLRTVNFDTHHRHSMSGEITKLEHDNEFRRERIMHDLLKWYSEEGKHYE